MRKPDFSSDASHLVAREGLSVAIAEGGEVAAFEDLWIRHRHRLFYLAVRILKNSEDAEDAVQESFLKAFRHLGSFDGRSQLSTWITRIVINTSLMVLRKKGRCIEIPIHGSADDGDSEWELPDQVFDIESHIYKSECMHQLGAAVDELPPRFRNVVHIYLACDTSLKEVANAAEITLPAVKSRLLRAKRRLRASLASRI